jgi:hypothetical protein
LRLDSRNLTPQAYRKVVFAGGDSKSNAAGARSLKTLAEWNFKATRVSELTVQAGREMKTRQTARVEQYHQAEAERSLSAPRPPALQAPPNLPQVGVVEMDGGRLRTRKEGSPRGVSEPHWREFQAGCVVRLQSEASDVDPRPKLPDLFLQRPQVQKLVTQLHRQRHEPQEESEGDPESIAEILEPEALAENALPQERQEESPPQKAKPGRPKRLVRTCVATLEGADACGRILAAEAADRGLHEAARKGFISDGQSALRHVWERYFKRLGYIPILDFIHLMSYVYALAMAVSRTSDEGWQRYTAWITLLWSGSASVVLEQWRRLAVELAIPEKTLPENDPRYPVQRGLTYLANNLDRVDYPRYRKLGLPVTSTLMESLVKEFNLRVKGTEKFWNDPSGAEAILTVRAALLSEDGRFDAFFATRPGCCYRRRSTLENEQKQVPQLDQTLAI